MIYVLDGHIEVAQQFLLQVEALIVYPQVVFQHIELTRRVTQLGHRHAINGEWEYIVHSVEFDFALPVVDNGSFEAAEGLADAGHLLSGRGEGLDLFNALNCLAVGQL